MSKWVVVWSSGAKRDVLRFYLRSLLSEDDEVCLIADGQDSLVSICSATVSLVLSQEAPEQFSEVSIDTEWRDAIAIIFLDGDSNMESAWRLFLSKTTYAAVLPNGVLIPGPYCPHVFGPLELSMGRANQECDVDLVVFPISGRDIISPLGGEAVPSAKDLLRALPEEMLSEGCATVLPADDTLPVSLAFVEDGNTQAAVDLIAIVRSSGYDRVAVFPPALDGACLDARYVLLRE